MTTETYKRPTDADLPAALAKEMGLATWVDPFCGLCFNYFDSNLGMEIRCTLHFLTDRNHSRLAVEECKRLDLMEEYTTDLLESVDGDINCHIGDLLLATPAQESRAAYRTLWEYRNLKTKESPK